MHTLEVVVKKKKGRIKNERKDPEERRRNPTGWSQSRVDVVQDIIDDAIDIEK
jgi:hypothetical protein